MQSWAWRSPHFFFPVDYDFNFFMEPMLVDSWSLQEAALLSGVGVGREHPSPPFPE